MATQGHSDTATPLAVVAVAAHRLVARAAAGGVGAAAGRRTAVAGGGRRRSSSAAAADLAGQRTGGELHMRMLPRTGGRWCRRGVVALENVREVRLCG